MDMKIQIFCVIRSVAKETGRTFHYTQSMRRIRFIYMYMYVLLLVDSIFLTLRPFRVFSSTYDLL